MPKEITALKVEHDLSNEQVIIATVLHDEKLRDQLTKKYSSHYFTDSQHAKIWDAIIAIRKGGLDFDMPALHKQLGGSVPLDYVRDLVKSHPKAAVNIRDHIQMLEWDVAKVNAIEGPLTELLKAIQANDNPNRIQMLAKNTHSAFNVKLGNKYMSNAKVLARQAADEVRARRDAGHYEYGIGELDYFDDGSVRMIPGCAPGDITLITGVSGSAKSTVAAYIAYQQARMEKKVLMGAWEMGQKATIGLMACFARGWDRAKVQLGQMSDEELKEYQETCERLGEYIRFFDAPFSDNPSATYTNEDALGVLYQNIADSGCSMCVMDLWERGIPDSSPERERHALFTQQAIAQETGVHCVMVVQQKSKAVEASADKRPSRDKIFGSGAYVDISDTILGIHRVGLFRGGIEDDTMEILVFKQRYGKWPLAIEFDWNSEKGTIKNGHEIPFPHASDQKSNAPWLDS